jgi:NTE family protein
MKRKTLRSWLNEGPFTLALSSSFFGFYAHCGVAEALLSEGFMPSKITGSSAGALVGGALASGLSPSETKQILFRVRKSDFWDPFPGFGLLRGKKFLRLLEDNFEPTFAKARIPFEAAVFDILACRTRFLSEGQLPKAVVASCAVPLLFHPVRIGHRIYTDGGIFHKSGIHLKHASERLLSIFLLHDGIADAYELGHSLGRLGPNQRVLRMKNLPRIDYNSLENGPIAYAEALRRAREALKMTGGETIIDG